MTAVLSPPQFPGLRPFRPERVRPASPRPRSLVLVPPLPTVVPKAVTAPTAPTAVTYRRRRLVALVVALVVVVGLAALVGSAARAGADLVRGADVAPAAASAAVAAPPKVYVVRSGDTLWSIARQLQPDGDIRPLVDALAERAGSSVLRPGQRVDLEGLGIDGLGR